MLAAAADEVLQGAAMIPTLRHPALRLHREHGGPQQSPSGSAGHLHKYAHIHHLDTYRPA